MRPTASLALVALLALAGCAAVEDTAAPPAELTDFEPAARIERVWTDTSGDAFNRKWVRMTPSSTDGDVLYVANVAGQVSAYDREDGARRWRVDADAWLSAGVGSGAGGVYVGSSEGTVIALDADDGSERWRRDLVTELLAAPAVASAEMVLVRAADGRVVALSSETGETAWTYDADVPSLTLRGNSQPVPVPGGALIGLDNGRVVALEGDSGEPLWESTVAPPEGGSPIERMVDIDGALGIGQGVLYAATYQGQIAQIEPREGEIGWSRELSSYAGLSVDAQRVYVTDERSHVRALDPDSGTTLWRQDVLAHRRLTAPVPVPGTDYLAVADYDGYVHLLTRGDGRLVARHRTGGFGILADPVPLDEGRIAVQTQGAKVLVLEAAPLE
ncbi:MAG: outer membrane protein assembly factor BamB [Halofilum sp. (in: g-proteobacteria)]